MIGYNKTNVESVKEIKTKECYLLSGRIIELGLKSFISIKGLKNFSELLLVPIWNAINLLQVNLNTFKILKVTTAPMSSIHDVETSFSSTSDLITLALK